MTGRDWFLPLLAIASGIAILVIVAMARGNTTSRAATMVPAHAIGLTSLATPAVMIWRGGATR